MVGGRQHGGFEWASRALSLRWFISDSAQIMEYQGACTEALLVSASIECHPRGEAITSCYVAMPLLSLGSHAN